MLDIFHKDGSTIIIFCTGNGKYYQAIKHHTKQEKKDTGFYNIIGGHIMIIQIDKYYEMDASNFYCRDKLHVGLD